MNSFGKFQASFLSTGKEFYFKKLVTKKLRQLLNLTSESIKHNELTSGELLSNDRRSG